MFDNNFYENIDRTISQEFYKSMDQYLYCLSENPEIAVEEEKYIRNNYKCKKETVWVDGDCLVILK